jgi:hypothetical protein
VLEYGSIGVLEYWFLSACITPFSCRLLSRVVARLALMMRTAPPRSVCETTSNRPREK